MTDWAGDLARPAPLVATLCLAVNDHLLKGAGLLPGAVTGKLSDVAGLFVAGVLAVCLTRAVVGRWTGRLPARSGRGSVLALGGVAAMFAALKLSAPVNAAVAAVWGHNALDASDLFALPVLGLAMLWLRDRDARESRQPAVSSFRTGVALAGVLLFCAATPAPPPVPPRPIAAWVVDHSALTLPCGEAAAWVSKSGKTGFGLTVRVTPNEGLAECPLAIERARFQLANGLAVAGQSVDVSNYPTVDRASFHYVLFEFDNNSTWNRGVRTGSLELELVAGGQRIRWSMPGEHQYVHLPVRGLR